MSNGMTLFSSPDNPAAANAFNLKEIMLTENENLSFINKIDFKFIKLKDTSRKVITLKADPNGYNVKDLDNLVSKFFKEWQEELVVDIVHENDKGQVKRILKFSTNNKQKVKNYIGCSN